MVREGRYLPPQWSQSIRGGTSYIKGNINRSGERILPFQQFYPRGSHELSSLSIMRQAAGVLKRSSVIGAPHAPMLHRSKTASGDTAKLLAIIGADDWSVKTTALTYV